MKKPILAILTEAIRFDNQDALKYFNQIKPVHFYESAPYGDLKAEELVGAIKYDNLKDLERKLLELKPDIIQGAEPYASRKALKICLVAKKISKQLNIPLIFPMLENRPPEIRFGKFMAFFLKKILKSYAKQAKMIFYLNEGAKRNLLEVGTDPTKLKKLLYGIWGVDTTVYKPMKSEIRNPNDEKKKILFIGRLEEAKGIPYLMEAWQSIAPTFPNVEIEFAGQGKLENIVTGPRVKKLGMVKNADLPKIINEAYFVVLPSVTLPKWEEQVGMTNLQALACGVPVITSKSGAIPEYINDKVGILVAQRDSKALAAAMVQLLKNDALRYNLGEAGRAYILENFDAQKTVEKTQDILLDMSNISEF